MAAARTSTRRTATKPKAAPAPEPEELDEELENGAEEADDEELEELEEDDVAAEKPAGKKTSAADSVTFGIRDLVAHIKKKTGQDTDPRAIRTLIRKMARDGSGRVDREITAGNRTRYDWTGPNDPEVKAIVAAFEGGELEADKKEKLAALKQRKAAQVAAKKKAAAEAVEEDEDEEPTPAPRRRRAAKTAAPTRRRKPAPVEEVEDDEELDLDEE